MAPLRAVASALSRNVDILTDKILHGPEYDFSAMHKRACAAILVLNLDQKDVAERMGADMSLPLHLRKPFSPTLHNVQLAAKIIGISVEWLTLGESKTDIDDFVVAQIGHIQSVSIDELIGDFDHVAINNRVYSAIFKTGRTLVDVALLFGMDPTVPLRDRDINTIPRFTIATMVKLSDFLGVSVRWMLYGDLENEVDVYVSSPHHAPTGPIVTAGSMVEGVTGPTVVQKNDNSTVIVKNIQGEDLNDVEREALRFFRRLTVRRQTEALASLFKNYA